MFLKGASKESIRNGQHFSEFRHPVYFSFLDSQTLTGDLQGKYSKII